MQRSTVTISWEYKIEFCQLAPNLQIGCNDFNTVLKFIYPSIHIHFLDQGAVCVPFCGVGSTRLCQTLALHTSLSSGSTPARPHLLTSVFTHSDHTNLIQWDTDSTLIYNGHGCGWSSLSSGSTPARPHLLTSVFTHSDHTNLIQWDTDSTLIYNGHGCGWSSLSSGSTPARPHLLTSVFTHSDHTNLIQWDTDSTLIYNGHGCGWSS